MALKPEDHPIGAERYHGDHRKGQQHCRCVVIGHVRGKSGAIRLRRLKNDVEFTVVGQLFQTWDSKVRAAEEFRRKFPGRLR